MLFLIFILKNFDFMVCSDLKRGKKGVDYYPFGMVMPEREYDLTNYKFGFNNQLITREFNETYTLNLEIILLKSVNF